MADGWVFRCRGDRRCAGAGRVRRRASLWSLSSRSDATASRPAGKDAAGAVALLERQQLRTPARYTGIYGGVGEPELRAELLAELGRPKEALAFTDAIVFYSITAPIAVPPLYLLQARLLEAL